MYTHIFKVFLFYILFKGFDIRKPLTGFKGCFTYIKLYEYR